MLILFLMDPYNFIIIGLTIEYKANNYIEDILNYKFKYFLELKLILLMG